MGDQVWLGVDVGTQSVRVTAIDDQGLVLGSGSSALKSARDGSRHEQDPRDWWNGLATAARQALSDVDRGAIAGLAIDSTSGTILLAAADGTPLTPGLMYDDVRDPALVHDVDVAGDAVWRKLGYRRMQPSWALPKLLWLCANDFAARRPGARLLHQADLLTWRLAGRQLASDSSHALKTGYDLLEDRWPEEVFDALEVPSGLLPDVSRPGTVLGTVGATAAEETLIPEGTPIVAGMTDGCASQLGSGALRPGTWNSVIGTTLVLKGVTTELIRDPLGIVYCHRGPQDSWLPGGASNSGAGALSRKLPGADFDALTRIIGERGPSAIAYPLAGDKGERFPLRAPDLEPFVLGDVADDAGLFGALLLGVACVERLCYDYLDLLGAPVTGPITFTGGGTKNRYWSQLRADMLGSEVLLPADAGSARGMAVLAAAGVTGRPAPDVAAELVRVEDRLTPDGARNPQLSDAYLRFVDHLTEAGHLGTEVAGHAHRRAEP
ncbi:FGGY-family carbohydrate kinase [Amycolatopsis sp. NPDC058340]|uniref:FGGY-family carbohydrate kinase n=1 Tax=Amycolatopsis sp. NPDC058340 TaxID=3346453 RepID=UPI0036690061